MVMRQIATLNIVSSILTLPSIFMPLRQGRNFSCKEVSSERYRVEAPFHVPLVKKYHIRLST